MVETLMTPEQYVGRVLDRRYHILEFIATGGMAWLFRAVHVGTGRALAVKILTERARNDSDLVRRFQREARLTARLKHENIVDIFDVQTDDDCYLVMELLDGVDLRVYLRQAGRLPWAQVRAIMLQVCAALQFAHEHGVVHRDLKPANCFRIDPSGWIKVLDLGIAKPMSPLVDAAGRITLTGGLAGTPAYMAPEQFCGHADARTDIFSAGVLMFELLTGRRPFCGKDANLLREIVNLPMPALASVADDLDCPLGIDAVVGGALAKLPEERYFSMRAFAGAIEAIDAEMTTVASRSRVHGEQRPLAADDAATILGALRTAEVVAEIQEHDDFTDRPTIARPRATTARGQPLTPEASELPAPKGDARSGESPVAATTSMDDASDTSQRMRVETADAARVSDPIGASLLAPVARPRVLATLASGRPWRRILGPVVIVAFLGGASLALLWQIREPSRATAETREVMPPANDREPATQPDVDHVVAAGTSTASAVVADSLADRAEVADAAPKPAEPGPVVPPAQPLTTDVNIEDHPKPRASTPAAPRDDRAAARALWRQRAPDKVRKVLVGAGLGNVVSQVKVSVRWSASGEVTEATLHHLPECEERTRAEARLRELKALISLGEPFSVEQTFDMPLPG